MTSIPDRTAAFKELVSTFGGQPASAQNVDFRSDDAVLDRARKYVAKMESAVSGEGGHNKTFAVACALIKGFELSTRDAMDVLQEYNQRCDPAWTEHELQHKIDSATRASGSTGYLRNAKPERWDSIRVPEHTVRPESKIVVAKELPKVQRATLRQAVDEAIEEAQQDGGNLIDLGFNELNYALGGGVAYGEMVLAAARPSHGKSAMALQMIHAISAKGVPCAFMSEEMRRVALGDRTLLYGQSLPKEQWRGNASILKKSMSTFFSTRANCFIIENSRSVERCCDEIRKLVKEEGVKAIAVDYVQLLTSNKGSRYETVTATSVALRQIISETGIMMIALAQMSRAIENRESGCPRFSDLKESGQLEQDADVVMFLVWPSRLNPDVPQDKYEIWITKNRNRELKSFKVDCTFDPERQTIRAEQKFSEFDND